MKFIKQLVFCAIALSVLGLMPGTGFAQDTAKEPSKVSFYKKREKPLWLGVFPALMVVVALAKIALATQRLAIIEQSAITEIPLQDVTSFLK